MDCQLGVYGDGFAVAQAGGEEQVETMWMACFSRAGLPLGRTAAS